MKTTSLEKRNRALFEAMQKTESLKPALTFPKLLAFTLALLIHLLTIACAVTGMFLLALAVARGGFAAYAYVVLGLIALAIAWGVAPRFAKMPDKKLLLRKKHFPILYSLVDRI